jgi:hypothetical protein
MYKETRGVGGTADERHDGTIMGLDVGQYYGPDKTYLAMTEGGIRDALDQAGRKDMAVSSG